MGGTEGSGGDIAALVDSSLAALWLMDAEKLRVTFMSRGVEAIAGYPCEAWLEPGFWWTVVDDEDRDWVKAFTTEQVRKGIDHEVEYRLRHRNGAVIWVRDVGRMVTLGDGREAVSGLLIDITQRKGRDEAAAAARRLAEAAAEAAVAREARRLAAISAEVAALRAALPAEPSGAAGEALGRLEALLAAARPDPAAGSGAGVGRPLQHGAGPAVALPGIVAGVRRSAARLARARGGSLTVRIAPSANLRVGLDAATLDSLLLDLLIHAVTAVERPEASAEVAVEGGRLVVRVAAETGASPPGAWLVGPALSRPHAGGPASPGAAPERDGLASLAARVAELGGAVEVDRALAGARGGADREAGAEGRRFAVSIAIPVAVSALETLPEAAAGRTILYVEDDPTNGRVMAELLRLKGIRCDTVQDGTTGLARLAETRYDAVLLDLAMPEMSGFEVARQIRAAAGETADGRPVPIVAVTAHVQPEDLRACRAAGMDDHIGKPVTLKALSEVLDRHLDWSVAD